MKLYHDDFLGLAIIKGLFLFDTYITRDNQGNLVGRRPGNYFLFDGLGSVVALTDASGNVVNRYAYDPYRQTHRLRHLRVGGQPLPVRRWLPGPHQLLQVRRPLP